MVLVACPPGPPPRTKVSSNSDSSSLGTFEKSIFFAIELNERLNDGMIMKNFLHNIFAKEKNFSLSDAVWNFWIWQFLVLDELLLDTLIIKTLFSQFQCLSVPQNFWKIE